MSANSLRGEAELRVGETVLVLRPSFSALVAAEEEIGPLFALADRAAEGQLRLNEIAGLFWHCADPALRPSREVVGEAIARQGLAACGLPLRALLTAILKGSG